MKKEKYLSHAIRTIVNFSHVSPGCEHVSGDTLGTATPTLNASGDELINTSYAPLSFMSCDADIHSASMEHSSPSPSHEYDEVIAFPR